MKRILLSSFPRRLAVVLMTVLAGIIVPAQAQDFRSLSKSFEERAADLVRRMTLDEKISQMQNEALPIRRLGIPYYNWSSEGLHGIVNEGGNATVFPQAIGLAATWDTDLMHAVADVISTEARAWYRLCLERGDTLGIHRGLTYWSPNINIFRDPRWGRGQETYGEDPTLTSRMGVAYVTGLQGSDPKYFKAIATPKHYAVHSGPEPLRHQFNAVTGKRDLYETYLPAFEACVREGGAYSVMSAYSKYLGVPCSASSLLLKDLLRTSWGFKGYVVSDCGAIGDIFVGHRYARDAAEASAIAVKTGTDITCGTEYVDLKAAVKNGQITEPEIDVSVYRLMMARLKLGMFDPPSAVPYARIPSTEIETESHRRLALEAGRKAIVLLKNEGNLLPLDRSALRSVAVIGPYCMRDDVLYGNYSGISRNPVTFLQGLKNRLGDGVAVEYTKGVMPLDQGGSLMTVPTACVFTPDGKENGLLGEYFDNIDLRGKPVFTQVDRGMAPYWDKNSPGKGVPADFFSVRWTGTLTPPETGTYILGIVTDDRGRMYFGSELKVDNWNPCQKNVMKTFRVAMEKGKRYPVRIEYADSTEYAGIRFQWKRDDFDTEKTSPAQMMARAVDITKRADVAIVFAGISANLEGEEMSVNIPGFRGGDKTDLEIPAEQKEMLNALHATGKPIVLVLTSGSALALNWENEHIPAILHAWYPGEEGGNAVADVLLGTYNPAGRLPVTFYRSVADLPPFEDYAMKGRTYRYFGGRPLYPFGYGLSYATFEYSGLALSQHAILPGESVNVSVTVKNAGSRDGEEVVQLYVRNLDSREPQPLKSLRGFRRIPVRHGESVPVTIPLKADDLRYYSETADRFVVEPGRYEIQVGASSEDIRATAVLEVGAR
jgi:beta-glucosidase